MIKVLTEKQLAHALFYSIKQNDFEHALTLVNFGASFQTAFLLEQDKTVYTTNYFVGKVAETVKKYGYNHSKTKIVFELLDKFIENKADFRCHCSSKNNHYCALSEAFKYIKFQSQDDLFIQNNLLILKLLYHGATYKNHKNQACYKWVGIQTLLAYIETRKDEAFQLLRKNRHNKCATNRNFMTMIK